MSIRHRIRRRLLGELFFVSLLTCPAAVQTAVDAELAPIFAYWDQPSSPGAAAAVVQDGRMLYTAGFGLASLEFGVPITPQTSFNAGSVAKQFTATAILMLAAGGELSLDDKIRRHVPELPDSADAVTLRQLLHHTSGVRDIWALTDLGGWMAADVRTQEQALRILSRQKALNFRPGSGFLYSNSGYLLLAEVVARVTGQPFPAWVDEHLFSPLGMTATYFYEDHARILPNNAHSYRSLGREKGFAKDILNSGLVGGGNLVTNVADLARWADHLLTAELGGKPLLARLSEQGTLPGGLETGYGMGLFVGTYRGLPVVHHGGASAGYRSQLLIFVNERLSVIVLGNVNTVRANELAHEIADVVLAERFPVAAPGELERALEPLFPLEAYTGIYAIGPRMLLHVRVAEGRLFFLFGGATPREMFPSAAHAFSTAEAGVTLAFTPGRDRTMRRVVLQVPGRRLEGRRLEPTALSASQARAYAGRYVSDELETSYTIVYQEGDLTAERLRGTDIALTSIGDDRFIEALPGDLMVSFKRNRSGRVSGFELSVDRARRIEFEKE